jgi:putative acyl-CoA dehydrogenase
MDDFASEAAARITVGKLATLAAAAALEATAPPAVAEASARTRLAQQHAALYGADRIEARTAETLLQRALPEL